MNITTDQAERTVSRQHRDVYTIGQMAQLCDITTKQLRHYDDKEILCPAVKDENTGYRYYTYEQIEEILLIKELRYMGVSLKTIAMLLHDRNLSTLRTELEHNVLVAREEIQTAQRKYDQTIDALLRVTKAIELIYRSHPTSSYGESIRLTDFPPRQVLFTRYNYYWHIDKLFTPRRAELYALADKYSLTVCGPNMAIFHGDFCYKDQFCDDPAKESGDLETCFAVQETGVSCPHVRTLGGFTAVTSVFVGPYSRMKPQYEAMELWALEHGYELNGTSLEEYISGATMTKEEADFVTRLYLPLKGSLI